MNDDDLDDYSRMRVNLLKRAALSTSPLLLTSTASTASTGTPRGAETALVPTTSTSSSSAGTGTSSGGGANSAAAQAAAAAAAIATSLAAPQVPQAATPAAAITQATTPEEAAAAAAAAAQKAAAWAATLNTSQQALRQRQANATQKTHFTAEFEINDFPQSARYQVTHRETLARITEYTGTSITTRGVYVPTGHTPRLGERKLYLFIEGKTLLAVNRAKKELKRFVPFSSLPSTTTTTALFFLPLCFALLFFLLVIPFSFTPCFVLALCLLCLCVVCVHRVIDESTYSGVGTKKAAAQQQQARSGRYNILR